MAIVRAVKFHLPSLSPSWMGWCFFQDHKCIDNIDNLLHSGFTHLSAASSRYLLVTGLSRKTEGLMSRVLKWNCMGCGIQIRTHTEVRSRRWFLGRGLVSSYHSNHVGQGPKRFIIFFLSPFSPPSFVCEIELVSVLQPRLASKIAVLLTQPAGRR